MRARGSAVAIGAAIALIAGSQVGAQPADDAWLLVAEQSAGRIVTVAPDGSTEPVAGRAILAAARGISLHPDGASIAVVDGGSVPETGAVWVFGADGTSRLVADGLDFPEGVTWLDESTLIVTSFADRTVLRVDIAVGAVEVVATLPAQPTGVIPFEALGRSGVLVTTWQGPAVLVDPANGETVLFDANLEGGGFPAPVEALGTCVPEFDADRVRCFDLAARVTADFGPFTGPVAVSAAGSGLVVTGEGGVARIDIATGEVTPLPIDLANPAGVITLGGDPGPWAPALPIVVETTAAPTTAAPTTAAPTTTVAAVAPAPADTAPTDTAPVAAETTTPAAGSVDVADDPVEAADPVAPDAEPEPEPEPAGDGDDGGVPWWAFLVFFGAIALAALVWLLSRKPPPVPEPPLPPLRPHELPDEVKKALAAAAACDEDEFWKWYWRAEDRVLWLQELMRNAADVGDRTLFEGLEREQRAILDALRDAPALLRECGRPGGERGETGRSVDPIPAPCFELDAIEVATGRELERLAADDERRRARLAELDDEQTAARHATEEAERDGERATAELAERERDLATRRKAALASDAEMAEEYQRRRAGEIERLRTEMESANRAHQEFVQGHFDSAPGTPEFEATRRHMLESQRRYREARRAYHDALPPGADGTKEMARRARAELRDEAAGAEGLRDAVDAERWDAARREEAARERFAELEREREELNERLAGNQARREELDRRLEEARRRCEEARSAAGTAGSDPTAPGEPAGDDAGRRYVMQVHTGGSDASAAGVRLQGPGFDQVFSFAGTGTGDAPGAGGPGGPPGVIPVEITEEQFDECRRRLEAWTRTRPVSPYAPVPDGDDTMRCPAVWLVVRPVFADTDSFGSSWFGGCRLPDDALEVLQPEAADGRPERFDWDRAVRLRDGAGHRW